MGKRKSKALLLAVALLIMTLGMGSVVYATTYTTTSGTVIVTKLQKDDILEAGTTLQAGAIGLQPGKFFKLKNLEDGIYEVNTRIKLIGTDTDQTGITTYKFEACPASTGDATGGSTTDTPSSSTSEDKSESQPVDPVQAWKASNANPENYLPKLTLADGTTVQSTVASHFAGNASAAVIVTTPEGDFNKALGISGGYAHLMGSTSQCGEQLKAAFADYAKVLGENLGVELTLGDIFDLKTEVREKGTYKLLDTVKESSEPVTLSRGLQGEMLKAAKAGYDFAVICYTDGKAVLCKDVDTEVSTITINTTITSGTYAIIYGPKGCFDGIE